MAQGAAGVEIALDELTEADLEGLRSAPLLRVAQAVARRDERVTLPAVLAGLDEDAGRLMSEIAVEGVPTEGLSAEDCVRELRRQPLKARMAEIQKRLAGDERGRAGSAPRGEDAPRAADGGSLGTGFKEQAERPWRFRSRKSTTRSDSSSRWARRRATSSTRR